MEKKAKRRLLRQIMILMGSLTIATFLGDYTVAPYARAQTDQTIVEEWATVKTPPAPALKPVTVDPKVTAFLILDIQKQQCNAQRRPRCVASVPKIQKLLTQARAKGVFVVYSLGSAGTVADILPEVAPREGDPVVKSNSDKFLGTDLDKILKDKGIKTVIVVGTAASGAVLYTSSGASLRGFQVVVPVEGMSDSPYPEQYTAWHLANSAATRGVTLTRIDMIQF